MLGLNLKREIDQIARDKGTQQKCRGHYPDCAFQVSDSHFLDSLSSSPKSRCDIAQRNPVCDNPVSGDEAIRALGRYPVQ